MKNIRIAAILICCLNVAFGVACTGLAQASQVPQAVFNLGPYIVQPVLSSATCVDISSGSSANGTAVQAYSCNGTAAQSWTLLPVTTSYGSGYEVVSSKSGSCLNVSGDTQAEGSVLQEWQCLSVAPATEIWQIYAVGSNYELVSLNSGKCMDLRSGNTNNGTPIEQWDCGGGSNPNQLWTIKSSPASPFLVQSIASGPYLIQPNSNLAACADVGGGSKANGTSIQSYSCNGTASQSWSLLPVIGSSAGTYKLVSSLGASCLSIAGNAMANGAKTVEWQCLPPSQPSQLWQLWSNGLKYELVSVNSGKCLDLTNGNSVNGNQLEQWDCDNFQNPNQLWNLKSLARAVTAPVALTATTTTVAQASPNAAVSGQTVVLSAAVSSPAAAAVGKVSFFCDSALVGTVMANAAGMANIATPSLAAGPHIVSAQFLGANGLAPSSSSPISVMVSELSVGEQALPSDSFVDSVGIQTHLTYSDTGYGSLWPQLLAKLKESGIRHLRDGLYNWGMAAPYNLEHQALAAAGIKTTYGISLDYTMTPALIKNLAAAAGDLEALEAPNECDAGSNCGGGGATGINSVVAFMPSMAAAGNLLQVPVIGPSFTIPGSYANAGDLSSKMAYSNLHVYFAGRNPGSLGWGGGDAQGNRYGSLSFWMDQAQQESKLPVQITETGYIGQTTTNIPYTLPDSVEASYTPRTLLIAFNHGVKRTFMYELLDEVSSPGYGLLKSDGSEKPAFTAVKGLMGLLADPGNSFSPGKLDYSLLGGDSTINHTLLQKRDGSFWLAVWSEQSSYDPAANLPTAVTPQNVFLSVSGAEVVSQIVTFNQTGNFVSTTVAQQTQSVAIAVTDQLTLVQITPPKLSPFH